MPQSTLSQSSTPTPFNGTNGPCNGSDSQWNQVHPISPDTVQNRTPLEWRELPAHNIIPGSVSTSNVSSAQHYTNAINSIHGQAQQVAYNPPSYMNSPYQRSAIPNGYTALAVTRAINGQVINAPKLIRTPNGQIIGGSNWPNQAAVGRFVSQTPTWTSNKTSGGVKKQKRIRTAFTSQQMMELEQEYARTRYLDRARRIELADVLRLNERTIKIWFQNRRMKEKKDRAESLEDSEEASITESSPEVGNIQMPMLVHEQYPNIQNEVYNQEGIYIEPFVVSSTSAPMPTTSLATTLSQVSVPVQNVYQMPEYVSEEQCHAHYQQVQVQVQHYPPPYGAEVRQSSPKSIPQAEAVSSTNAPSDIIEKSWDLSWLKSIQIEEEY